MLVLVLVLVLVLALVLVLVLVLVPLLQQQLLLLPGRRLQTYSKRIVHVANYWRGHHNRRHRSTLLTRKRLRPRGCVP